MEDCDDFVETKILTVTTINHDILCLSEGRDVAKATNEERKDMNINRNPDNRIEINRCGSLINFNRIFEVLNNKAWNERRE